MPSRGSPPEGHGRFALLNQTGNRAVRGILRSPLHGLLSRRLALIAVTGRRSGRVYTIPVGYSRDGDLVTIGVGWPDRKVWWRNLRDGAPVRIRLRGVDRSGQARAHGDVHTGVTVRVDLDPR
ncbi:MAG TPA: nitroreductase/quinone reductase family protein [Thermoleophilaceae bacterium]|nr:nitroreductase/quinone reductase family protein [Thermoleophilaceae bacterium]